MRSTWPFHSNCMRNSIRHDARVRCRFRFGSVWSRAGRRFDSVGDSIRPVECGDYHSERVPNINGLSISTLSNYVTIYLHALVCAPPSPQICMYPIPTYSCELFHRCCALKHSSALRLCRYLAERIEVKSIYSACKVASGKSSGNDIISAISFDSSQIQYFSIKSASADASMPPYELTFRKYSNESCQYILTACSSFLLPPPPPPLPLPLPLPLLPLFFLSGVRSENLQCSVLLLAAWRIPVHVIQTFALFILIGVVMPRPVRMFDMHFHCVVCSLGCAVHPLAMLLYAVRV